LLRDHVSELIDLKLKFSDGFTLML
jgi:hypothetical protein